MVSRPILSSIRQRIEGYLVSAIARSWAIRPFKMACSISSLAGSIPIIPGVGRASSRPL
jgi:hypothetical protein